MQSIVFSDVLHLSLRSIIVILKDFITSLLMPDVLIRRCIPKIILLDRNRPSQHYSSVTHTRRDRRMIDGDAKLWHRAELESGQQKNETHSTHGDAFVSSLDLGGADTDVPIRHDVVGHPAVLQPL